MKLPLTEVKKISYLARILLKGPEAERFRSDLSQIIDFNARKLAEARKGAEFKRNVTSDLGQSDKPRPSLSQEEALANAPRQESGHFSVLKVMED